jgi:hypothetical protein
MADNEITTDLTPNEQAELDAETKEIAEGATAKATTTDAATDKVDDVDGAAAAAAAAATDKPAEVVEDAATLAARAQIEATNALNKTVATLADALKPARDDVATTVVAEPDFDKEKSDLTAKWREIKAQHSRGEIDDDELERAEENFENGREAILERKTAHLVNKEVNTRVQERAVAAADTQWNRDWSVFMANETNAAFIGDHIRKAAYHVTLNDVAAKNPNMPFPDMMKTAMDQTKAAFGIQPDGATAAQERDKIAAAEAERQRKAGKAPTNVAVAPSAGVARDNSAEAALDALPISDLEDTLARMTEAQREAYLRSAPGGSADVSAT